MTASDHSHVELAHLATIVRDLAETMEAQARAVQQFASLVGQQTDLRDVPKDLNVFAPLFSALHQQARQLAERLEEKIEAS